MYYESLKSECTCYTNRYYQLDFVKYDEDYNYILELVKPLIGGHEHE